MIFTAVLQPYCKLIDCVISVSIDLVNASLLFFRMHNLLKRLRNTQHRFLVKERGKFCVVCLP